MTFRPVAGQPLRLVRGRWFFFADSPNVRGDPNWNTAHDPRHAEAQRLTRSFDPYASRASAWAARRRLHRGKGSEVAAGARRLFPVLNRNIEAGVPDARTRYNRNNINCQQSLLRLAGSGWQGRGVFSAFKCGFAAFRSNIPL
jgi:hypothetical protein